jgi:hypothetical protein
VAKRTFTTTVADSGDSKQCPFLSDAAKKDQLVKQVNLNDDVIKVEQKGGHLFVINYVLFFFFCSFFN